LLCPSLVWTSFGSAPFSIIPLFIFLWFQIVVNIILTVKNTVFLMCYICVFQYGKKIIAKFSCAEWRTGLRSYEIPCRFFFLFPGINAYRASTFFARVHFSNSRMGCAVEGEVKDIPKEKLSRHRTYLQIARMCKHDINGRKLFQPGNFQGILVSYGWEANPRVWIIEYERC